MNMSIILIVAMFRACMQMPKPTELHTNNMQFIVNQLHFDKTTNEQACR